MESQINAIKQLLEINNITASQIEGILVKALGDRGSWEDSSTCNELADLEYEFGKDEAEISLEIRWILQLLWRSRIDLNDARINAEEVDLEEFLANYKKPNFLDFLAGDEPVEITPATHIPRAHEIIADRDREISLLKAQVKGLEAALEPTNSKAIAPNLGAFQEAVNAVVNPALIEKIAERDRELERVNGLCKILKAGHEIECDFAKTVRDKLDLDEWNSNDDVFEAIAKLKADLETAKLNTPKSYVDQGSFLELKKLSEDQARQIHEFEISIKKHHDQFDSLKSLFDVTLRVINMSLNGLKGDRKPDEVKEVDGVMVKFRNYDDNLTHHQKTIIIGNVQRAIAEEIRKLKGLKLEDFSFDEIPF